LLYRVTMVVKDYILMTSFLKFFNLAQLIYPFSPVLTNTNKIGQTEELTEAKSTKPRL